jgi:hypothetical protein
LITANERYDDFIAKLMNHDNMDYPKTNRLLMISLKSFVFGTCTDNGELNIVCLIPTYSNHDLRRIKYFYQFLENGTKKAKVTSLLAQARMIQDNNQG